MSQDLYMLSDGRTPPRATASQNEVTQRPLPHPLLKRQTLKCCDTSLSQLHGPGLGKGIPLQVSTSHRLADPP